MPRRKACENANMPRVAESRLLQISSTLAAQGITGNTGNNERNIIYIYTHKYFDIYALVAFPPSGLTNRRIIVHTSVPVPPGPCSLLPK